MKTILILSFILASFNYCFAQDGGDDRVEAVRMAYITKELQLTPAEAQRFWPVYNGYMNEIKGASDNFPNDEIKRDETIVNIRKKYKPEFKKILNSDDRVNKVYVVDRNYRELLRKELQKRQQGKP